MKWLEDVTFRRTGTDRIEAVMPAGNALPVIRFTRLFPLRDPERFISVICEDSHDADEQELGVLKTLTDLPADQQAIVRDELKRSFFLPEIVSIRKVTIAGGIDEWHVATDRGDKTIILCDRKQSIHVCHDGMLLVTDMDKCRYRITHPDQLDSTSKHHLERVMP